MGEQQNAGGPYELDVSQRSEYLGCSELGAAHNVDPFLDIHAVYVRRFDGVVQPPTKRMLYGKYFEEAILHAFVVETGIKMRPSFNKTYRHPEFPKYHLAATPDGLPEDDNEGGLEVKQAGWDQRHLWGSPDDAVPLIPPRVELQVRGNMAVFRKPRWHIALWCGSDRLLTYIIERDLEFEDFILNHAERVWQRYFERRERPPIGASPISAAWLKQKWPTHKRPDIRPATEAEIALLDRYARVRVEEKKFKKERDLLENKLKDAVENREGLSWPHGTFTWRKTKDSTWVNWEAMAIGLRTHYIKDPDPKKQEEARQALTDLYTNPKPGYRVIRFQWDGGAESEEEADAA